MRIMVELLNHTENPNFVVAEVSLDNAIYPHD